MFKKKQRESRQPRQRPDLSSPRNRPAFSYHAQRQPADTNAHRNRVRPDAVLKFEGHGLGSLSHKLRQIIMGNVLWALITAAVVGLLLINGFINVGDPRIVTHGTSDQRVLLGSQAAYTKTAKSLLASTPLYRLKFSADAENFNTQFIKKHPEVASAQLSIPLIGQTPTVHITPASPVLRFTSSKSENFVIDSSGYVIHASGATSLNLPLVQDQSTLAVKEGAQALSSKDVQFIQRLNKQLVTKNMAVTAYQIPPSSRQLIVQLKGKSYHITFTFENDVLQQVGALIATQKKLEDMSATPAEYIDVRVGDRVYYK